MRNLLAQLATECDLLRRLRRFALVVSAGDCRVGRNVIGSGGEVMDDDAAGTGDFFVFDV